MLKKLQKNIFLYLCLWVVCVIGGQTCISLRSGNGIVRLAQLKDCKFLNIWSAGPIRLLVLVYCSLVRSVVEYASPVWAALPIYLQDMLEAVQKKALYIILGKMEYKEAMVTAGLQSLCARRNDACVKFIGKPVSVFHLTELFPAQSFLSKLMTCATLAPGPCWGVRTDSMTS